MTKLKMLGRKGIGPAPDRCTPEQKQAWDDLVRLVEPPGFLIWRDAIWIELCAMSVALARDSDFSATPEEVSNVCALLKGLTLGPDCLPKLGLDFDWLVIPDPELLICLFMTNQQNAGELPPESQFKLCQEGFQRTFHLMAEEGFDPAHILPALLASTQAAITNYGDNLTDKGLADWLHNFVRYLNAKELLK